jgi:hypothetical protein
MAEFYKSRSRLNRKEDEEITKKTVILGGITVLIFVLVIVFGLPLLVKLSVMLGNAKSQSKDNQVKVIPPLPPRLVVTFEATNSASFSISGVAEPNVNVELLKNDLSLGKESADDTGSFVFNNITLDKGDNVFTALASTDKEGNSDLSKAVTVTYDDQPPSLKMINPSEDTISVDSADFDVVGQSDKGVSVTVNGKLAMVDDNGQFKLKVQLNAGENDLNIVVQNIAGNQVTKTIKVTYDI